ASVVASVVASGMTASGMIVVSVASGCGDGDLLSLLRGGNTSGGGTTHTSDGDGGGDGGLDDGDDGTLYLLLDGRGGGEDDSGDRNGDMYLLLGGTAISSAIAIWMAGGRVNGARTLFLVVGIICTPIRVCLVWAKKGDLLLRSDKNSRSAR
ncbi:hypothetical protein Tco_0274399, partial [Tanacetum coccineum]